MDDDYAQEKQCFAQGLTDLLITAMTSYAGAIRWVEFFVEQPDDNEAKEQFDRYGRNIGVELIGFVRLYEAVKYARWAEGADDDPAPIVPLARLLGESFTLLLLIEDKQSAENLPMASMDETAALYTFDAKRWLHRCADEIPELVALDTAV